jgi:hypothetical protein
MKSGGSVVSDYTIVSTIIHTIIGIGGTIIIRKLI